MEYLYKFMPFNQYALSNIIMQQLHFSHPKDLNDPADCSKSIKLKKLKSLHRDYLIKILSGIPNDVLNKERARQNPKALIDLIEDLDSLTQIAKLTINKSINEVLGICSFSKKKDAYKEPLMWAHYADSSRGICLVFDKKTLFKELKVNTDNVAENQKRQVIYGNLITYEPQMSVHEVEYNDEGDPIVGEQYFLEKSQSWGDEEEYRLYMRSPRIDLHNPAGAWNVRYKKSLKRVIIGERADMEQEYVLHRLNVRNPQNYNFKIDRIIRTYDNELILRSEPPEKATD